MKEQIPPSRYLAWADQALAGAELSREDAHQILTGEGIDEMSLCSAAGILRRHHFGDLVNVHILDNVRNGACPEDCNYCGQSVVSDAGIQPYKLKPVDEIVADALSAKANGAYRFCMALSGRGPREADIDHMCKAIEKIAAAGMRTCLSAGLLDEQKAARLHAAGLDRLNHNLNTSRSHYPTICTTHTFDDRLATVSAAKKVGLGVCSGMIVGMGESHDDVLEVAYTLRQMEAESIPVNFLLPIEGNPLTDARCNGTPLSPRFVLRVLSLFRLLNPAAEIRVAAGREIHLRSLQAMALWPANSLFVDGYLLTEGSGVIDTLRMIHDAGFRIEFEDGDDLPAEILAAARGEAFDQQPRRGMQFLPEGATVLKGTVKKKPQDRETFVQVNVGSPH